MAMSVGHWIDQMPDNTGFLRWELKVFAAERDDAQVHLQAGDTCNSVRLQTGAGDQLPAL